MTTIHVDEDGNIRKGPPLPLPLILDGIYETSTRSSYLNASGNESQIPPPMTGRRALAGMSTEQLRHATASAEPVENGFHFGHVENDENGEVDADQMRGINQQPYAPFMRMLYTPHSREGSLFTSQRRPPPGAPADPGPGLPRAPGGGVAPPAALSGQGKFRGPGLNGGGLSGRSRGAGTTAFDAARANEAEDAIGAMLSSRKGLGSVTNRMHTAQQRGASGPWNPLEMMSEQASKVLSDAGTYALSKGASAASKILHHGINKAAKGAKKIFGVSKKSKSKKKKHRCKSCQKKGKSCNACSGG